MKIVLKGTPIAKVRHRCRCIGRHGVAYDPQVKDEMAMIKHQMAKEIKKALESEDKQTVMEASNLAQAQSFKMVCTFLFPVAKSINQTQRNLKLWGFDPCNSKPDFDNLAKFYADCGKGIFWPDDCQITFGSQAKYFDENPRTEIEIVANKNLSMHEKIMKFYKTFSPEEINEFINDATFLAAQLTLPLSEVLKKDQMEGNAIHFEAVAKGMIDFANKYADKLKKLKNA